MGAHNTLHGYFLCPYCGMESTAEVECHFGYTSESKDLTIGETYPWRPGRQPQNGGRPDGGTMDGDGYMLCPICEKGSHLLVKVRGDIICEIAPNYGRDLYDACLSGKISRVREVLKVAKFQDSNWIDRGLQVAIEEGSSEIILMLMEAKPDGGMPLR